MHISKNKLFFLSIDVFFDEDSNSENRILRTALVFELYEEKELKNPHNKTSFEVAIFRCQHMKLVFFIAIILFFAAEFIYENSSLLCGLNFRLVYNNFKFIFNKKNSHEENVYHNNSHRH